MLFLPSERLFPALPYLYILLIFPRIPLILHAPSNLFLLWTLLQDFICPCLGLHIAFLLFYHHMHACLTLAPAWPGARLASPCRDTAEPSAELQAWSQTPGGESQFYLTTYWTLCLSFLIYKTEMTSTTLFRGLSWLLHVWFLRPCLACSKQSVHIS